MEEQILAAIELPECRAGDVIGEIALVDSYPLVIGAMEDERGGAHRRSTDRTSTSNIMLRIAAAVVGLTDWR